jgi:glutamate synthase (NADPH/NADH) large chain
VVVLGSVGWNLAAGMSGGELFVLDRPGHAERALNGDLAGVADIDADAADRLKTLVEAHLAATGSPLARRLLGDWDAALQRFVRIVPLTEIVTRSERLKTSA